MVPTYSPHCADSGGTLLLSSPTHSRLRQTDNTTSAIRSLRRSLSRSPSKPAFRFITSNSTSPSPKSPLSPSQPSPPPRPASASRFTSTTPSCSPSPLAIPFPPSSRINRTSARRSAVSRPSSRTRASPDSPAKRALSECRDNGNAIPASPSRMRFGVERRKNRSLSPATDHKHSREDTFEGIRHQHLLPYDKVDFGFGGSSSATASPLKRSDGIMNLDQASLGSPAAKRRSLHGPSHEADFNIFELGSATDWHDGSAGGASADENCADFEMSDTQETLNEGSTTPMPKRSSSLRKSTLSQRHNNERPTFARSRPNADLSAPKGRPRMSLDNYLAPMPRDSPFSSNGALPSSSLHPMAHPCGPPQHQPHPLSRTITQSSSGSSIVDDSPTHVPTHHPIRPRNRVDFSKSLPPGAFRPTSNSQVSQNSSAKEHPSDPSYATPDSHNFIRPYQPAFMSTGLISKRNRTLEDLTYGRAVSKAQMPDTPCKKSTIIFSDSPVHPGGTFGKPALAQPEFGTPSTPFSTHASKTIPGTFGKGLSIFGNSFLRSSLARRNSFVSVDCDEDHLLDGRADSQNSDYDLPPTPTKSGFGHVTDAVPGAATVPKDFGKRAFGDSGIAPSTSAFGFTSQTEQNSKFIQLESLHGSYERESDGMFDDSPTHLVKRLPYGSASAAHVRVCGLRRSHKSSASALSKSRLTSTSFFSTRTELVAKPSSSDPVSPVSKLDFSSRVSPHTPQESAVGTTGSIAIKSGQPAGQNTNIEHQASSSPSSFPPATPTAPRDYFQQNRPRRSSINPIAGFVPADSTLTSRFDKVELIGSGEFSHVYRVSKSAGLVPAVPIFSNSSPLATSGGSPVTSVVDRVYAIKMSRKPYTGMKDRERKRQEIVALKALGQGDHIVHYFDSWEEKNHLYIQTEFCEEGSLDLFLAQVGRKARLDDFRIWKVLLELALVSRQIYPSDQRFADILFLGRKTYPRPWIHSSRSQACQCSNHL